MPGLPTYGPEGPLGFPMTDKQARNLEAIMQKLGHPEYRKTVFTKAPTELNPGERSDVSWISTETPDRYDHIVIAKGMDDSQFALNPIVTLNHDYSIPPVGRSLWRKFVKDGDTRGIKAKTIYPPKPADWPANETWRPDLVFMQIQAGLLNGKSIGWLSARSVKVPVLDMTTAPAAGDSAFLGGLVGRWTEEASGGDAKPMEKKGIKALDAKFKALLKARDKKPKDAAPQPAPEPAMAGAPAGEDIPF